MKIFLKLILAGHICFSTPLIASVVKNVVIDSEAYSCRPSNLEPRCSLGTDGGFNIALAADSADARMCIYGKVDESVVDCFIQKRIKFYAKDLDIQIASKNCRQELVTKCSEVSACIRDGKLSKCGHLGNFLQAVEEMGLDQFFSEKVGYALCERLVK
jgi:hypothetical protein